MRHLKAGNRLGVTTAHRRAMMRNMVTSILENGQVTCTLARAKEVRKPLEKMISWGKQGDLHARRQALRFVKSKEAMSQLFEDLAERYKDRQGGYCRIIKLGKNRLGDNSEMAIVQLLGSEADQLSSLKSKSSKKKQPKKKDSTVLKEVSEEVQTEASPENIESDTSPQKPASAEKVQEPKQKTEVDAAPVQKEVAEETAETAEIKAEEVPAEAEVASEDVKAETKAETAPAQNETEPAAEQTVPEESASEKKAD
ncbi:MAG: 50S ribosomal protein L17 [SAR324 cluster bacterium]|nr:50S ribosomal protein L17 [SAR324 cluster bacterium]